MFLRLAILIIALALTFGIYRLYLESSRAKSQNSILTTEVSEGNKSKESLEKELQEAKTNYEQLQVKYEETQQNLATTAAQVNELVGKIKTQNEKLTVVSLTPVPALVNNSPPDSGYRRQTIQTDVGNFTVDVVTANLDSTKVLIDTASDDNCSDNCPTKSLSEYVSRTGAYAGVNGTYFCPAEYPSCAGKTGSFDLLVMNKNKKYFNSDNNVYSTNPAVACYGNTCRFMERASDWGRSTDVDGVISNFPLLLLNGEIKFAGNGDAKMQSKGNRSYLAGDGGSRAYIGVVYNVTVAESAKVMKALGFKHALNLDSGGSTALWFSGYKSGPGRTIPNAVLFVRK